MKPYILEGLGLSNTTQLRSFSCFGFQTLLFETFSLSGFGSGGYKNKFGYNNRKISTDSGISAISSISTVSRSTVDTVDSEDREVRGAC